MRILCSGVFFPQIGGMERQLEVVARELTARGHSVHVATLSAPPRPEQQGGFPFPVSWRPSIGQKLTFQRWADVVLHFGLGLRLGWPALFTRTPQVVSHQFCHVAVGETSRAREVFKNWLTRWVTNISASRAIAASIPVGSTVIPNCYDEGVFFEDSTVRRDRDLVFVGRLVPLKGVDLLLEALQRLDTSGLQPNLTIIGDGPEREALQRQARPFGARVTFVGARSPSAIAEILRKHRVLVVPSRWNEPFGIVALEGIACGCVVVGSAGGGLPDAIGACGLTFPNGNGTALVAALRQALIDAELGDRVRAAAPAHLRRHTGAVIAGQYEAVLQSVVATGRAARVRTDQRASTGRAPLFP